ncbi:MAG: maleylpyruvate isomerase family mycothiol-dependent enzyme [Kineosporiaceae bacterium]|jgi:uncharacterized protein (TIGR03086 family)
MSTLEAFDALADALTDTVDHVQDWNRPSPCEGWAAADVIDHIVDTQRDFLIERGLDLGARPDGDPAARWSAHRAVIDRLMSDPAVADTTYEGYFGRTTIGASLALFYGFDLIVHRWDIAMASGQPVEFSTTELDTLENAIEGFGEALYAEGICKPALPVPPDASRQTAVLARLGRLAPEAVSR